MQRIIDYDHCSGSSIDALVARVKAVMLLGFQPFGGVIKDAWCEADKESHPFVQIMVKYESEGKNALEEVKEIFEIVNK